MLHISVTMLTLLNDTQHTKYNDTQLNDTLINQVAWSECTNITTINNDN